MAPEQLEASRWLWICALYGCAVFFLYSALRATYRHKARREYEHQEFCRNLGQHGESLDRSEREREGFLGNTTNFEERGLDNNMFVDSPGGHMLRYKAERSLSFHVIFMFEHTLLSNSQILRHMLVSVLVAALVCCGHIAVRRVIDVELLQIAWLSDLDNMSNFLTSLIGILLGFYISTVMTRWWSMRSQGIGGLWGAVDDLCILTGTYFPGPEWRRMRSLVLRYGLLSFELVFMQNEGRDEELDTLVQRHLLTPHEAACLANHPSKCSAVWAWVAWIFRELQKQGHMSDVDLRLFLDKVLQARGGAGSLLALIDTQLPFLYVQLLSSLVHFLTMVMAADCGVMTGAWIISQKMSSPVLKFVQMLMVTYFYNGCLEIGRSFANPCGHDFSDFPRHAYHFWMRNEAEVFHSILERPPLAGVDMLKEAALRTGQDGKTSLSNVGA